MDYIKLIFSNREPLGNIYYGSGFQQIIYLQAQESLPKPEYVEEGEEDGDGNFVPTFKKVVNKYSITVYGQRHLVEALSLLPLHDDVEIIMKTGLWGKVEDVEVSTEELEIGCFAKIIITFRIDFVTKTNC